MPLALSIRQLHKSYRDVIAVDGLDLDVETGECFGLLGPNGAGKTTTIEICEGLTDADRGEVTVLGRQWNSDAAALRELIGVSLVSTRPSYPASLGQPRRLRRSATISRAAFWPFCPVIPPPGCDPAPAR